MMRSLFAICVIAAALVVRGDEGYRSSAPIHRVEALSLTWHDTKRNRDVPAKIYFPAFATGACPVIIFSHGLGGSREGYAYLGRHWASHGYVSVHLQHVGSDDKVWRGARLEAASGIGTAVNLTNSVNRPLDVRFAIDELGKMNGSDGPLRARLDLNRIGMAGHSFGAWTTLAIAGQQGAPGVTRFHDSRVKAAVAMSSPAPANATERTYAQVRIPVLHMTGTDDDGPFGTKAAERRVPYDFCTNSPQYLVTFEGGDHMVFAGRLLRSSPRDIAMQELIKTASTAFWDAYLKENAAANAWLTGGGFEKALGEKGKLEMKNTP